MPYSYLCKCSQWNLYSAVSVDGACSSKAKCVVGSSAWNKPFFCATTSLYVSAALAKTEGLF